MTPPRKERNLKGILPSLTRQITTGCGVMHVTLCWDNRQESRGIKEIIVSLGKPGGCAHAQNQAIAKALTAALTAGADPVSLADAFVGINCGNPGTNHGEAVLSCGDAIGKLLKDFAASNFKEVRLGATY